MEITARVENMEEVIAGYRGLADDQLPYATALSLTSTAKIAQGLIQRELPLRFTIRRLDFAQKGVRVTAATKASLEAIVRDIHPYMVMQETGGTKIPYGRYLAVPIIGGARKSQSSLIRKEDMPGAVMASGGFIIAGKVGNAVMYRARFKRKASRRGFKGVGGFSTGKWEQEITAMYVLLRRAPEPKRYGFEDLVRAAVNEHWEVEFGKAFAKAQETRR